MRELAAVARHFDGTRSIHSGSGKQAEVLESIGRSTAGQVNYKISGELQLQLFDVLSEQPAASPWRALYERMVERWLGNLVGSRDARSPDGDRRFFKEKLDEPPRDLIAEVQKRNTRYIVWLAEHLMV